MTKSDDLLPQKLTLGRWLWNPFHYTAGVVALVIGLVAILLTGLIGSVSNTHFDGVLDTHTGFAAPIWLFLAEGIINWVSLSLVLWGLALWMAPRKFRAIDLWGTQALARWPFLLTALITLLPGYRRMTAQLLEIMQKPASFSLAQIPIMDALSFVAATMVMLLAVIWFVIYAWKSYRESCDFSGGKAVTSFVIGIILAEVISKVVIYQVMAALV